uniref:Stress enhanced protein 2 n=1 Tax=Kalanchoe fedtschenkoi TaxID=63787 RepID=A0A7N0TSU4_KALFE
MAARVVRCCIPPPVPAAQRVGGEVGLSSAPAGVKVRQEGAVVGRKQPGQILLQPRVCTLRSYGGDRFGVLRTTAVDGGGEKRELVDSTFMQKLFEYIESSKKSHEVEIVFGRLAMVVFAATVAMETSTGTSVFKKVDVQALVEAAGVCFGAVALAAAFAWMSQARTQVGRIINVRCNAFIDSLIDQIVDGLFYEAELSDWSDDT